MTALYIGFVMIAYRMAPHLAVPMPVECSSQAVPPHITQAAAPEDTLCSVQVVQEDPAKVLQVISRQTKTNLVLLSSPTAKLTINLSNVRLIEMIRHICALTQLTYLKVGSTFVLAGDAQLKTAYPAEWAAANPPVPTPEPAAIVTKVYRASYVSSSGIAETLAKLFDKAKLSVVAGPVEMNPSLATKDTSATTGVAGTSLTSEKSDSSSHAKTLIMRGDAATVAEALRIAEQMDTPRPQVMISATIYDISNDALRDIGMTWTPGDVSITEKSKGDMGFGTFSRAPQTFSAAVKALEQKDQAKLLASPNISVLDGERAYILIGDRINYPVLVGYTQANTPIFNRETERVGIYLQVAASVGNDQAITLGLYPQVSSIVGYLNVDGASYPQVSTREAQTTLRVHSGETIILGGLLRNEDIASMDKLPILGDLPFIGELFRHRKKSKAASQVIISIKPILITPDEHR